MSLISSKFPSTLALNRTFSKLLHTQINNAILHVKVYLWKCKLMHLVPPYVKLKEFIEYRKKEPYLEQFAANCNIP